ncbi:hypothetical protein [Pseudogracilibacillus auburnensis]|nr:hypothetical protein [Pseudogracilibacillus auburnensis]MBO1005240.1 hypothetical protein [Pseudogracilibacillus auburnensis]
MNFTEEEIRDELPFIDYDIGLCKTLDGLSELNRIGAWIIFIYGES